MYMYAVLEATESVIADGNADVCSALRATYIWTVPKAIQIYMPFLGPTENDVANGNADACSVLRATCTDKPIQVYMPFLGPTESGVAYVCSVLRVACMDGTEASTDVHVHGAH